MVAFSVVMTVVVLNFHHRTTEQQQEMPRWVSVAADARIAEDGDDNSYKKVALHLLRVIKSCMIIEKKLKNSAHSLRWKQTYYST